MRWRQADCRLTLISTLHGMAVECCKCELIAGCYVKEQRHVAVKLSPLTTCRRVLHKPLCVVVINTLLVCL